MIKPNGKPSVMPIAVLSLSTPPPCNFSPFPESLRSAYSHADNSPNLNKKQKTPLLISVPLPATTPSLSLPVEQNLRRVYTDSLSSPFFRTPSTQALLTKDRHTAASANCRVSSYMISRHYTPSSPGIQVTVLPGFLLC